MHGNMESIFSGTLSGPEKKISPREMVVITYYAQETN